MGGGGELTGFEFRICCLKLYKTIDKILTILILSLLLYGCETWSLASIYKHGLRVFENRVLSRIFGPARYVIRV
jgi:hypothetical protein